MAIALLLSTLPSPTLAQTEAQTETNPPAAGTENSAPTPSPNASPNASPNTSPNNDSEDNPALSAEDRLNQKSFEQYRQGDYQGALTTLQDLLQRYESQQNDGLVGETWNGIGLVQESLQDPNAALDAYQKALEAYTKLATTAPDEGNIGQARTLNSMGGVYVGLSQADAALGFFERALVLLRELNASQEEAITLLNLGGVYAATNKPSDAIQAFQQSLTIGQKLGDTTTILSALERLSVVYTQVGAFPAALNALQQAVSQAETDKDQLGAAIFLSRMGELQELTRDFDQARVAYERSLQHLEAIDEPIPQQQILVRLAGVYSETEQLPKALESYQKALAIATKQDDPLQQGEYMALIGTLQHQMGDLAAAQQTYEQAVALIQPLQIPLAEGQLLRGLGAVYHDQNNLPKAFEVTQQALARQRSLTGENVKPEVQQQEEGLTLNQLGDLYRSQQKYDQALANYQEALGLHRQANDPIGQGESLRDVALTLLFQGKPAEAVDPMSQSLEIWEVLAYHTGVILDPIGEAYQILQVALLKAQKNDVALVTAEQERSLPLRFQQGWQQGLQATPPAGLTLEQILQVPASQKAPLLFYDVGSDIAPENKEAMPRLRIWLVSPTGEITVQQVDLNAAGITELDIFLNLASTAQTSAPSRQKLAELLIEPIAANLEAMNATQLLIVPPPGLTNIPFDKLPLGKDGVQAVGDRYTFQVGDSIQALTLKLNSSASATPSARPATPSNL